MLTNYLPFRAVSGRKALLYKQHSNFERKDRHIFMTDPGSGNMSCDSTAKYYRGIVEEIDLIGLSLN